MIGSILSAGATIVGGTMFAVVALNGAAALLACLLQFGGMRPRLRPDPTPGSTATHGRVDRFVSVHVPTHDEPPDLVIATLHHLAAMTAAEFEVIVIDNNTPDPATWQPVADAAAALGPRFRFYHFDGVAGAKAGALNLALGLVDPRTTHVAVVDADYQVTPDFLRDALDALAAHPVDYVQFPQAYRGVGPRARGVERELGDYFACFSGGSGRAGAMLPTGTLSVFALDALREVGGWSAATITEDADLGVRLQAVGRKGLWLATEHGTGLLPLDFAGLQTQRARWVAGNVQVLLGALRRRGLPGTRSFVTLFIQLTAWVSLWLLPAATLVVLAVVPGVPHAAATRTIAAATIVGTAVLTAVRMYLAMPASPAPMRAWSAAATTKLALTWTAALAWLPVVVGRDLPFRRTLKVAGDAHGGRLDPLLAASLVFLAVALVYAVQGAAVPAAACALLAMVWPASRIVDANLRGSTRRNAELA